MSLSKEKRKLHKVDKCETYKWMYCKSLLDEIKIELINKQRREI